MACSLPSASHGPQSRTTVTDHSHGPPRRDGRGGGILWPAPCPPPVTDHSHGPQSRTAVTDRRDVTEEEAGSGSLLPALRPRAGLEDGGDRTDESAPRTSARARARKRAHTHSAATPGPLRSS